VAKGFVAIGGNASYTLWAGHNPRADGGPVYQTPAELSGLAGLSEAEAASRQRRQAVDWALHHPRRELELIPLKLRALARGDSLIVSTWIRAAGQQPLSEREAGLLSGAADVASYALIAALLGTALLFGRSLWRVPAMRAVLAFLALAVPLYGLVYYGNVRYRIPLEPLMLLAVAALVAYVPRWRAGRGGRP
jgi:hypothetical protein